MSISTCDANEIVDRLRAIARKSWVRGYLGLIEAIGAVCEQCEVTLQIDTTPDTADQEETLP